MYTRTWAIALTVIAAASWGAQPAPAAITSVGGTVSAQIQEFVADLPGDFDQASKTLPGTADVFPLQVVARLLSQTQKAGGSAAAQLPPSASSAMLSFKTFT